MMKKSSYNVWIGGSVVTKDIRDEVAAAGSSCRGIREIMEEGQKYYFKKRVFDVEVSQVFGKRL